MYAVSHDLLENGYESVVLIGSDFPVFPREFLERAFGILEKSEADLVLGPNRDGGYYLIGMRRAIPEIFDNIVWSSDEVLTSTLKKIDTIGLKALLLPIWFDIDTPADLSYLKEIQAGLNVDLLPRTLSWLKEEGRYFGGGPVGKNPPR